MGFMRKTGIVVWGPVWANGAKIGEDEFGQYLGWAVNVPVARVGTPYAKARVFVRWYQATFTPQKRQTVECFGLLGLHQPGLYADKKDRVRMLIRCFGIHDVVDMGTEPIKSKKTYAQRQWGELVNETDPTGTP